MGPIAFVKEYWRILVLVLFVTGALVALFYPGGVLADDTIVENENETVENTLTNIEYGLGLEGGTRISAPPIGSHVTELEYDGGDRQALQQVLYDELEVDHADATVRDTDDGYTAEVFTDEVDDQAFADALNEAGATIEGEPVTAGDIENGVSQQTRTQIIDTIELRINEAGLSGGNVYEESTLDGDSYIVTEVPNMGPDELRNVLQDRGVVEVVAHYPTGDGQANQTVLERDDFDVIGPPSYDSQQGHHVSVTLHENRASDFADDMEALGFTSREGSTDGVGCSYDPNNTDRENYCLLTVVDGEVIDAHGMDYGLGQSMANGNWENDPNFVMLTPTQQDASSLSVNLKAGSLTAPLDIDAGTTYSVQPALADQFKIYSLLIGALSVLAVSGMVFLRYRNPKVALPMIVTATTEVVILLGFAALIRMPLDLSHVAGFIAVVGTGVDDLVIIGDEVMDDGEVSSQRVFESRFRKAFWVIGAAAATTIIALSPLAVLSLGDLRGFAIITILGVLVGVLITRPAYGDILQRLLTDR